MGSGDSARRWRLCLALSLAAHALLLWPSTPLPSPLSAPTSLQGRFVLAAPRTVAPPAPPPRPASPSRPAPAAVAAAAEPPSSSPPPAAAPPAPALRLPPQGDYAYRLRWQGQDGEAQLAVQFSATRYRLALQRGTAQRRLPDWVSEGGIGDDGLRPERFQSGRRAWQPPPGVQDRLSWIWQAAALAAAQGLQPGQRLSLSVLSWRGEAQDWVLQAEAGAAEAAGWLRLRRDVPDGALLEQLLWLDPMRGYLPVRLRVRFDDNERWEIELEDGRDISPTPAASE